MRSQFSFDKKWLPSANPAAIGDNFSMLKNLRPCDGGLRPVLGYDNINTTRYTAHPLGRNGYHFKTKYGASHTLIWTEDGYVIENKTAIPSQGDFESTVWHTDATGYTLGRFAEAPNYNMTYCNGKESLIWAGAEMRLGGLFTMVDGAFDGLEEPKDFSEIVNDLLQTTGHYFSLGTHKFVLCLTTRKAKGFKFYIKTANDTASTMTCKVYTGSWTAVSNPSDGTASGGKALAQTGIFSFDSTVSNAIPFHYRGNYAFGYLFELSAGTADVYHVTVDCPPQVFCDIWDGTFETIIQCQVKTSGAYEDYTADVALKDSYAGSPIGAEFDGLLNTDEVIVMAENRLAGLRIKMAPECENTNASVMTLSYWTGSAYTSASAIDWTQNPSGDTLGQGGYVTWNPPAITAEQPQFLFGSYGYAYKITFSAALSGVHGDATAEVIVDEIVGIPAQREIPIYRFTIPYKERLLGCGLQLNNEGNRLDYTPTNMPDTWNGVESSMFGLQSLRADTIEDLIAGITLFNRFGNNIFMITLIFTQNTTHVFSGDGPEDFKIEKIAQSIGCPAPLTLCLANIGFSMANDVTRNVALWLSNSGPMMFDGALMAPVRGLENYFDRTKPECISWEYISNSRAWVDPNDLIWHIEFPSGSGQQTPNVHVAFDLIRKERGWFQFDYQGALIPKCGFPVTDTNGATYIYGFIDSGYLIRMNYGSSWDGVSIKYIVEIGDQWMPLDNGSINVWYASQIREFKLICSRPDVNLTCNIYDCYDGGRYSIIDYEWLANDDEWIANDDEWLNSANYTNYESTSMSIAADTASTLFIGTQPVNFEGRTHRFRFEIDNSGQDSSLRLIGYGTAHDIAREDILAS